MQVKPMRRRINLSLSPIRRAFLLALFLHIGCAGGAGEAPPEVDGRAVAEPFLTEIRNNRVDVAWESTTAEFKSDMGKETFRRFARQNTVLKQPLEFVGYEPDKTNGITRGACDFRSPESAKTQARIRVLIAREGDAWKVERLIVE